MKFIKRVDYGSFVTRYKIKDFPNLDFKLYKVVDGRLIIISEDGDDLFRQTDGLYFLPPPGYDVTRFFDKKTLLSLVDSVSKLPSPPEKIKLMSLKK